MWSGEDAGVLSSVIYTVSIKVSSIQYELFTEAGVVRQELIAARTDTGVVALSVTTRAHSTTQTTSTSGLTLVHVYIHTHAHTDGPHSDIHTHTQRYRKNESTQRRKVHSVSHMNTA